GTMVGGTGGSTNPTILVINGHQIKADELIKSPAFHQAFMQFAYGEVVRQRAAKEGIKVDAAAIDNSIAEQKDRATKAGMKWDDVIKQQGMTDDDVREYFEMKELQEQLMKKLSGDVTDAELQDAWDKRKSEFIQIYAAQKNL